MRQETHAEMELARIALSALLAARGLTNAEFGAQCGVDEMTMRAEVHRGVASEMLRYRIERVLDFPSCLWSPANEIEVRKRCLREFGVDPRELYLEKLKDFCRKRGTDSPSIRTRENWFQMLVKWCRANPERIRSATR
jgi:hypothetical protein